MERDTCSQAWMAYMSSLRQVPPVGRPCMYGLRNRIKKEGINHSERSPSSMVGGIYAIATTGSSRIETIYGLRNGINRVDRNDNERLPTSTKDGMYPIPARGLQLLQVCWPTT